MSEQDLNEPAFPIVHPDGQGVQYFGMTLRDYFAAKAMQGSLSAASGKGFRENIQARSIELGKNVAETLAFDSYQVADAMLAARAGKPARQED